MKLTFIKGKSINLNSATNSKNLRIILFVLVLVADCREKIKEMQAIKSVLFNHFRTPYSKSSVAQAWFSSWKGQTFSTHGFEVREIISIVEIKRFSL